MNVNDLAILYQTKLLKVKRKIAAINAVGIKGEKYIIELENIDKEVKKLIDDYHKEIKSEKLYLKDLNGIYNNGMAKVELLESRLAKYDDYIRGYHYCEYLDSKLNGEKVSENDLNEYVSNVILFIDAINATDTRDYEEEKEIVEKVYKVAYQVMKLEFIVFGKSKIFDYAKDNDIVETFMNDEIVKDIEKIQNDRNSTRLIKERISKIKSMGINYSYLDKILITSIALKDDNSIINDIKKNLLELSKKIVSNRKDMKKIIYDITQSENAADNYKKQMHKNNKKTRKEIFKRAICVLGAAGIFTGFGFLGKHISKQEKYKTVREDFSSLKGYSCEEEYGDRRKNSSETKLYIYEPYEKYGSNYRRNYIVYDVSNISEDCKTLDDYLKLNLDHAASEDKSREKKSASDMTEEDFYDEVIYEVVKIVQDENDIETVVVNSNFWGMLIVCGGLVNLFYWMIIYSEVEFYELGKNKSYREDFKRVLLDVKKQIETFRRLADNNQEVKEEFFRLYSEYKPLIESGKMETEFNKLSETIQIPDPELELAGRLKKLTRSYSENTLR